LDKFFQEKIKISSISFQVQASGVYISLAALVPGKFDTVVNDFIPVVNDFLPLVSLFLVEGSDFFLETNKLPGTISTISISYT
jgi:hypothetical protein